MELARGPRRLLELLLRYQAQYGPDRIFPKQSTLARQLGVCRRTVIRQISVLLRTGYVTSAKRRPNSSAVYTLATEMSLPDGQNVTSNVTSTFKEVYITTTRAQKQRAPDEMTKRKPPGSATAGEEDDRQMWEWVGMTKQYRWYLRGCLPERSERLDRLVREAGGLAFLLAKKAAEGAATA